jgi:hypothetical protein
VNPLGFVGRNWILPREPIDFVERDVAFRNGFAEMLREIGL